MMSIEGIYFSTPWYYRRVDYPIGIGKIFKRIKDENGCGRKMLNKIMFQSMDYVLQTQLYHLCFPVVRKRFWQASKSLSNCGKKPITFAVFECKFSKKIELVPHYESAVIDPSRIQFDDAPDAEITKLFRFYDFSRTHSFDLSVAEDNQTPLNFQKLLSHCSFLSTLSLNVIMPKNWEQMLCEWDNPFIAWCFLHVDNVVNFASLKKFILKHTPVSIYPEKPSRRFGLHSKNPFEEREFLKYFIRHERGVMRFKGSQFAPKIVFDDMNLDLFYPLFHEFLLISLLILESSAIFWSFAPRNEIFFIYSCFFWLFMSLFFTCCLCFNKISSTIFYLPDQFVNYFFHDLKELIYVLSPIFAFLLELMLVAMLGQPV